MHRIILGNKLNDIIEYTDDDLNLLIKTSNQLISSVLNTCAADIKQYDNGKISSTNGLVWTCDNYSPSKSLKYNRTVKIYKKVTHWWHTRWIQTDLRLIQNMNKAFLKDRLTNNQSKYAVSAYTVSDDVIILNTVVPESAGCPKCGALLGRYSSKHMRSPSCMGRVVSNLNENRGWVKVQDTSVIKAIEDSGLEHDTQPVQYVTYAPKWVVDAATKFKKSGGYAGMKLSQYLAKMKDNK